MTAAAPTPRTRPPGSGGRDLVPLRPQGPIEIIDRATHVLRLRAGPLLTVSLAVQLPGWLLLAVVFGDGWAEGLESNAQWFWLAIFPDPVTFASLFDATIVGGPLEVAVARGIPSLSLAVLGFVYGTLIHDWALGRDTDGADALRRTARRLPTLVGLWALTHTLMIITCVGVVLGPIVFGVAAPLCAMEGTGPWQGLVRSWRLSLRRVWAVGSAVAIATFVGAATAALVGGVGVILLWNLTGGWVDLGGALSTLLSTALPQLVLAPILALSMALLALDLKVQVEGYDLAVEMATTPQDQAGA